MRSHTVNRTHRLFLTKLSLVLVLCVGIFIFSAIFMNKKSSKTISAISDIYMHNMSEEIALHFSSTIDLRFSQLKTLITSSDTSEVSQEHRKEFLTEGAKIRGFESLSFYTSNGTLETIYGETLTLQNPEDFLTALHNGERRIGMALDSSQNPQVLIGLPSTALQKQNPEYIALVAGLSAEYISDTLSLDVLDSPVYSHIIRPDGTFPFQNRDSSQNNYFEQLYTELTHDAENLVTDIQSALSQTQHYSAVLTVDGERRHLHCTKLAYSDWFLIVIMPYSALDQEISRLNHSWLYMEVGGCIIIIAALIWVFGAYLQEMKKKMEELNRLRQEAVYANKAKSEFLSNMSHDIRTPMNAITGMTAIAMANIDNKQKVENCLKKINLSSKHLLGLINDVLDMSKIESGKMTLSTEQISLREVVEGIVTILQPQLHLKHQKFDVFIRDISAEDICCDSVRLTQILLNILGNSVKFTPEGGSIQLSLYEEASPKGEPYIRIHLVVEDNGIGMTPEFQERIFDSFSRADSKRVQKTEGSGLGMAITKYIVDAMEGTIKVQSELDKGSRFHVILDLKKAQLQEVDMVLPGCRVLVVDDDPQLCESTVAALSSMGIYADWTLDAKSALEQMALRFESQEAYQLILSDWKLPEMDGIALARKIRSIYGNELPVLLTSAYDWSEISAEAKAAGVTDFLSKPLFRSTLFYGLKPYLSGVTASLPVASKSQADFIGRRILLAEDNDLNWEIASELLSDLGLTLTWAENGEICLEKFQASEVGFYDAILMDLRMPVMTGLEATKAIRALNRPDAKTIPIIAMTADAFAEDIQNCLNSGMNAHVAKPIDLDEVSRLLKKHVLQL
ncbi:MAG: response regulator [Lachnospiraceae bacterium]|jgi:two-component system sensor histidine kinase/response regulator|nr:response regulator [Lachnospiraceae bacterium]